MKKKQRFSLRLLKPKRISSHEYLYTWNEIVVKPSWVYQNRKRIIQKGLFAKVYLPIGTLIPIIGKIWEPKEQSKNMDDYTHAWMIQTHSPTHWLHNFTINGKPDEYAYNGIPDFGFGIYSFVNEPPKTKRPNAMFWKNHILIIRPVKIGEEIYAYYGEEYEPMRVYLKYTMENHPYKNDMGYLKNILETNTDREIKNIERSLERKMKKIKKIYRKSKNTSKKSM